MRRALFILGVVWFAAQPLEAQPLLSQPQTLPPATQPATSWVLMDSGLRQRPVQLLAIDEHELRLSAGGGQQTLPLRQFVQIERETPPRPPEPFLLLLNSGDRLSGQPLGLKEESLNWRHPLLGEMTIPLRQVRALLRSDGADPPQGAAPGEDVLTLANGDSVRGLIGEWTPQDLAVHSGEQTLRLPLESVRRIEFAAAAPPASAPATRFRLRLSDGSLLTGARLTLDAQRLSFAGSDNVLRQLPLDAVLAIEQINGPIRWLSALTPRENVHIPYLQAAWPAQWDRSVGGEPIRFAATTYRRGIGTHAYSRLVYDLDDSLTAFRTQYAIDGDRPDADVTVRIKLDDQVVHEQSHVRSGTLSPVVHLELKHARTLTLEVDYGEGYDVQDRLNWIEPALIAAQP